MKLSKKKICIIIIDLMVLLSIYCSNKYFDMKNAVNENVYHNLEYFKEELQGLNKNISSVLTVKDDYNNKEFISRGVIKSYSRCNYMVEKIKGKFYMDDYEDVYLDVNENIEVILRDNNINDKEREYLTTLKDYNNELLKECKKIMGKLYDEDTFDYEYQKKIEKKIIKTQSEFSKKADEILNQEKYKIIIDYRSKNKVVENIEDDFEQIKTYCEDVFSKVVSEAALNYNNKDENINEYIFKTHNKDNYLEDNIYDDETEYKLMYDRYIKDVKVYAARYITNQNNKVYNEQELDKAAQNTVYKFRDKVHLYDKEIRYDEASEVANDIDAITYRYIQKNDGKYFEGCKISITINRNKVITDFYLGNSNKDIIPPSITKKDIENKIDGEILDIITIVNQKGKVEYEVHIRENDIIYAAVFDGYDGSLKSYDTDIRNYGKIKN
ncbi:hypothetical protein [Tepidibacter sp. Z1-5]|uniref:hypothetical protein n=1 Tax=Tepidibacter sp. Z1-5 TaxID=3134138 RepID=UPI0030C0A592